MSNDLQEYAPYTGELCLLFISVLCGNIKIIIDCRQYAQYLNVS